MLATDQHQNYILAVVGHTGPGLDKTMIYMNVLHKYVRKNYHASANINIEKYFGNNNNIDP
jgi:isocitrate dehydrogenase